ncbi:hypothetical protein, partial [Nocardia gipuzkoensis]
MAIAFEMHRADETSCVLIESDSIGPGTMVPVESPEANVDSSPPAAESNFGAEQGATAGHTQQDFGGAVAVESALDELVDLFELFIQGGPPPDTPLSCEQLRSLTRRGLGPFVPGEWVRFAGDRHECFDDITTQVGQHGGVVVVLPDIDPLDRLPEQLADMGAHG